MNDEELFIDQGSNYFNNKDADNNVHIVRKGYYMEDGDVQIDDILLTLCMKYVWNDNPEMGEFDEEWQNKWIEWGGCKQCFANLPKEEV